MHFPAGHLYAANARVSEQAGGPSHHHHAESKTTSDGRAIIKQPTEDRRWYSSSRDLGSRQSINHRDGSLLSPTVLPLMRPDYLDS